MNSANSLSLLIPAAPALLAVIAFKKAQKQQPATEPPKPSPDWQWPKRWDRSSKTGER